jgi:hypothetical protein
MFEQSPMAFAIIMVGSTNTVIRVKTYVYTLNVKKHSGLSYGPMMVFAIPAIERHGKKLMKDIMGFPVTMFSELQTIVSTIYKTNLLPLSLFNPLSVYALLSSYKLILLTCQLNPTVGLSGFFMQRIIFQGCLAYTPCEIRNHQL